ncbi:hypothetical protein BDW62DRAFT_197922 [Aspergillus aurantiobrunneus]
MSAEPHSMPSKEELGDPAKVVKEFCTQAKLFVTSVGFQQVQLLSEQNTALEIQRDTLEEAKIQKDTTINELMKRSRDESNKQTELEKQILSLENTIRESENLVSDKEKVVVNLKEQLEELQLSLKKKEQTVEQAHKDINALQKLCQSKDMTIDNMKATAAQHKKLLSSAKQSVDQLKSNNADLQDSLRKNQEKLRQLESFAAGYHEEESEHMVKRFQQLWEYATTELSTHLQRDFPDKAFKDPKAWKDFESKSRQCLQLNAPLPFSNSKAARQMRFVVVLAILAREINTNIFESTYILPKDGQLRELLANLAVEDNEKESFLRSMLLSIDPDSQRKSRDERVQTTVRNISNLLFPFMSDPEYSEFRDSLKKVVHRSAEVWEPLQRSKQRYEPDFEPENEGWHVFEFPGAGTSQRQSVEGVPDDHLFTIFPGLSAVDQEGCVLFTFTTQLRSSMQCCVAAKAELTPQSSGSPTGRTTSARFRRMSIASNSVQAKNGAFLGSKVPGSS